MLQSAHNQKVSHRRLQRTSFVYCIGAFLVSEWFLSSSWSFIQGGAPTRHPGLGSSIHSNVASVAQPAASGMAEPNSGRNKTQMQYASSSLWLAAIFSGSVLVGAAQNRKGQKFAGRAQRTGMASVAATKPSMPSMVKEIERPAPVVEKPLSEPSGGAMAKRLTPEALVVPSVSELASLFVDGATRLYADDQEKDQQAIDAAYAMCQSVCQEESKTFFLGSQLLAKDERKAVWAIYDWCRNTDELVDGPEAAGATLEDLEVWEKRVDSIFNLEPTTDPAALALQDTIQRFPMIRRPFQDMIGGMAMDLVKKRYATFEEMEVYCYRVAGTVGLMTLPILGFDETQTSNQEAKELTIASAMSLGVAFQMTNILRDIGEDARRGRIYVPTEDLNFFGITEQELLEAGGAADEEGDRWSVHNSGLGKSALAQDDRWKAFMKFQIERCERYYDHAEEGVMGLSEKNRLGVVAPLYVYRGILETIKRNDYDNFSRRAYVAFPEKVRLMSKAWLQCDKLKRKAAANA